MGAPIFVDDGGSIRLRLVPKNPNHSGQMEDLLDVDETTHQSHCHKPSASDPYENATFIWLDEDGILHQQSYAKDEFDTILIIGDSSVNVQITREDDGNDLDIALIGDGIDPIVISKQHKKKRSYTVVNGGRISDIHVDGVSLPDFSSAAIFTAAVIT